MSSENLVKPSTSSPTQSKSKRLHKRRTCLVLLGGTQLLAGCALSLLAPFFSNEAEGKGVSVSAAGVVFSSVFVVQIVLTPVLGKYISRLGSSNLFNYGAILSGLTNVAFAFVPLLPSGPLFLTVSLVIRCVTAVGEAAVFTAVYPLASARASPGRCSSVLGWMETMLGLGTTLGPVLGGLLYQLGGFYLPFLALGSLLVLCGLLGFCILPAECGDGGGEDDEDGEEVNDLKYRSLLGVPSVLVASLVLVLTGVASEWYQPTLEPYLRTQFDLTPFQASLFFMIDGATYALATPIWGLLLDKGVNSFTTLLLGSIVISVSYLGLGPCPPLAPSITQVCVASALHGIGMSANFIATLTAMLSAAGKRAAGGETEQLRGMITSIWVTSESVGGFLGATGGAAAYDSVGWTWSCIFVAVMQVASMFLVMGVWLCPQKPSMKEFEEETRIAENNNIIGDKRQNYGTIAANAA